MPNIDNVHPVSEILTKELHSVPHDKFPYPNHKNPVSRSSKACQYSVSLTTHIYRINQYGAMQPVADLAEFVLFSDYTGIESVIFLGMTESYIDFSIYTY